MVLKKQTLFSIWSFWVCVMKCLPFFLLLLHWLTPRRRCSKECFLWIFSSCKKLRLIHTEWDFPTLWQTHICSGSLKVLTSWPVSSETFAESRNFTSHWHRGLTTQNILANESSKGQTGEIHMKLLYSVCHRWQFVVWRWSLPQLILTFERLQCPVLHPVLVYVEIVEDLGVAGGGAGQQAFLSVSHQPLAVVSGHVAGHVLFSPGVQKGLEASVQTPVHPLVGLMSPRQRRVPVHVVLWLADIDHLVGVELEHTLHLQLTVTVLRLVRRGLGHSLLLQLLPSSLALPYSSQIPEGENRSTAVNNTVWSPGKFFWILHTPKRNQVYRESSHKFLKSVNWYFHLYGTILFDSTHFVFFF